MEHDSNFRKCPRCEDESFEYLKSYGFCANCGYSTEDLLVHTPLIPQWALKAVKGVR